MSPPQPTKRPDLLLVSGLLCDDTVWTAVAELLTPAAAVKIVWFPSGRDLGEMAERLLAGAPPRFALAGHSMGARIALEVYRREPARVERVALLDTGVHPVGEHEPAARARLVALARNEGMSALADAWLPPMVGAAGTADGPLMARLRAMVERATPEGFAGQVKALLTRPDAEAVLRSLRAPTLLLAGVEDRWSPVAQHEAMQRLVPHARLVAVEAAGHMAPAEQPHAVAAALQAWLGD